MSHILSAAEGRELILVTGGARAGKSDFAQRLALFYSESCPHPSFPSPAGRGAGGEGKRPVLFVATAQAGDAEMEERIRRHRASRPRSWLTLEEPIRLPEAIAEALGHRDHASKSPSPLMGEGWDGGDTSHLNPPPQRGEEAAKEPQPAYLPPPVPGEGESDGVVLVDCLNLWVSNLLLQDRGSKEDDIETEILCSSRRLLDCYQRGRATFILVSNEVGLGLVPTHPLGRRFRDVLGKVNQMVAARADKVYLLVAGLPLELKSLSSQHLLPQDGPS